MKSKGIIPLCRRSILPTLGILLLTLIVAISSFVGGVIALCFQLPCPLLAYKLLSSSRKVHQRAGVLTWGVWLALSLAFNAWAPTVLSSDAQAGLVYIFYPIFIILICLACLLLFYFVWALCDVAAQERRDNERLSKSRHH